MIVLIPAYEPDEKLIDLIVALRSGDPDLGVVVVDDGSGPAYRQRFELAGRLGCDVVGYPVNEGKGHALKVGFARIADLHPGHGVVCADSDGQHSVVDILRIADQVRTSPAAMVLGTRRFTGDVPARSQLGNMLTRLLFRLATGRAVHDTQTGLRGYPAAMLSWLQSVEGSRYEYELNLLLHASRAGWAIESVDIATIYLDENQSSHFRPVADSVRIYAPLLKFSMSSLLAFAVDLIALFVLNALTGSLLAAVIGARVTSSAVNFTVNRRLVFGATRHKRTSAAAIGYFSLVLVLLAANYVVLSGLVAVGVNLLAAKVITELVLFFVSYTVQRRFVFAAFRPVPQPLPTEPQLLRRAG